MGASAVFSNGAVMSRVGSAVVATVAHQFKRPVIILCGIHKFSEAVRLDSFVWNEIGKRSTKINISGNPEELVDIANLAPSHRLPCILPCAKSTLGLLAPWRSIPSLKLLNIHYDVTPSKFVTMIACDLGQFPPTSCLAVLRESGGIPGLGGEAHQR